MLTPGRGGRDRLGPVRQDSDRDVFQASAAARGEALADAQNLHRPCTRRGMLRPGKPAIACARSVGGFRPVGRSINGRAAEVAAPAAVDHRENSFSAKLPPVASRRCSRRSTTCGTGSPLQRLPTLMEILDARSPKGAPYARARTRPRRTTCSSARKAAARGGQTTPTGTSPTPLRAAIPSAAMSAGPST